mmetsp:Transcript_34635/g.69995  ORF Transcript_34635/g.69995 Transcript_34635/m.69995 type:complete len:275 (+) Transcript_34635:75-899(+)
MHACNEDWTSIGLAMTTFQLPRGSSLMLREVGTSCALRARTCRGRSPRVPRTTGGARRLPLPPATSSRTPARAWPRSAPARASGSLGAAPESSGTPSARPAPRHSTLLPGAAAAHGPQGARTWPPRRRSPPRQAQPRATRRRRSRARRALAAGRRPPCEAARARSAAAAGASRSSALPRHALRSAERAADGPRCLHRRGAGPDPCGASAAAPRTAQPSPHLPPAVRPPRSRLCARPTSQRKHRRRRRPPPRSTADIAAKEARRGAASRAPRSPG